MRNLTGVRTNSTSDKIIGEIPDKMLHIQGVLADFRTRLWWLVRVAENRIDTGFHPTTNSNVQLFSVGHFCLHHPHAFPFNFNMLRTSAFLTATHISAIFLSHRHFSLHPHRVQISEVQHFDFFTSLFSIS
jgi:hypothetical protein